MVDLAARTPNGTAHRAGSPRCRRRAGRARHAARRGGPRRCWRAAGRGGRGGAVSGPIPIRARAAVRGTALIDKRPECIANRTRGPASQCASNLGGSVVPVAVFAQVGRHLPAQLARSQSGGRCRCHALDGRSSRPWKSSDVARSLRCACSRIPVTSSDTCHLSAIVVTNAPRRIGSVPRKARGSRRRSITSS